MPHIDQPLVRSFRDRLVAAPVKSPFLRIVTSDRGRLLDCSNLDAVKKGLASSLVNTFVTTGKPLLLRLDVQLAVAQRPSRRQSRGGTAVAEGPDTPEPITKAEHAA